MVNSLGGHHKCAPLPSSALLLWLEVSPRKTTEAKGSSSKEKEASMTYWRPKDNWMMKDSGTHPLFLVYGSTVVDFERKSCCVSTTVEA